MYGNRGRDLGILATFISKCQLSPASLTLSDIQVDSFQYCGYCPGVYLSTTQQEINGMFLSTFTMFRFFVDYLGFPMLDMLIKLFCTVERHKGQVEILKTTDN